MSHSIFCEHLRTYRKPWICEICGKQFNGVTCAFTLPHSTTLSHSFRYKEVKLYPILKVKRFLRATANIRARINLEIFAEIKIIAVSVLSFGQGIIVTAFYSAIYYIDCSSKARQSSIFYIVRCWVPSACHNIVARRLGSLWRHPEPNSRWKGNNRIAAKQGRIF